MQQNAGCGRTGTTLLTGQIGRTAATHVTTPVVARTSVTLAHILYVGLHTCESGHITIVSFWIDSAGVGTVGLTGTHFRHSSGGLLSHLVTLDLNNNSLTGSIPSEIGALVALSGFNVACNNLSGIVPPLPFSQYSGVGYGCEMQYERVHAPDNHFSCPLPKHASASECQPNPPTCK
jgi:hypothetical protein